MSFLATKPESGSFVLLMARFNKPAYGSLKQVTATYPVLCPGLLGLQRILNRCGPLGGGGKRSMQRERPKYESYA